MYCRKCGNELREGAAFCPQCGEAQRDATAPQRKPAAGKKKSGRTALFVVIGVLAAAVCVLAVVLGLNLSRGKADPGVTVEETDKPAATEAPSATETPVSACGLPDISAWAMGAPGTFGRWPDEDHFYLRAFCDDPDAYFSYLELLEDERCALEPLIGEPVREEFSYSTNDGRIYEMMYRYTGTGTVTHDAVTLPWNETVGACDVLVTCEINRSVYEAEGDADKSGCVILTLHAFPEAVLYDAGAWDGTPSADAPRPPEGRLFQVHLIYSDTQGDVFEYYTEETFLGPALEKAGLLRWGKVNNDRLPLVVNGISADIGDGERWACGVGDELIRRPMDEVCVSEGTTYYLALMKGTTPIDVFDRLSGASSPTQRPETTPEPEDCADGVSLTILIEANGEKKSLSVTTEERMLGPALRALGLIDGTQESWGYFIHTVAGIRADTAAGEFWSIDQGDKPLQSGIDDTPLSDGDTFTFVLVR